MAPAEIKPEELAKIYEPAEIKKPRVESIRPGVKPLPPAPPVKLEQRKTELVGPIEELEKHDLETFRALANSPRQAARKIKEKIDILGEESLVKKDEAIKAWHKSKMVKLYLDLGKESIKQGKTIDEILNFQQISGKPTLTKEEFETINELNNSLAF